MKSESVEAEEAELEGSGTRQEESRADISGEATAASRVSRVKASGSGGALMLSRGRLGTAFVVHGMLELLSDARSDFVSSSKETLKSSIAVGFRLALEEADAGGPFITRFLDIARDSGEPRVYASMDLPRVGVQHNLAMGLMLPADVLLAVGVSFNDGDAFAVTECWRGLPVSVSIMPFLDTDPWPFLPAPGDVEADSDLFRVLAMSVLLTEAVTRRVCSVEALLTL